MGGSIIPIHVISPMHRLTKSIFLGILLSLTTTSVFSQGMMRRQSTTLKWHSSAKEAFAEAAQTNRPVLAVFR